MGERERVRRSNKRLASGETVMRKRRNLEIMEGSCKERRQGNGREGNGMEWKGRKAGKKEKGLSSSSSSCCFHSFGLRMAPLLLLLLLLLLFLLHCQPTERATDKIPLRSLSLSLPFLALGEREKERGEISLFFLNCSSE